MQIISASIFTLIMLAIFVGLATVGLLVLPYVLLGALGMIVIVMAVKALLYLVSLVTGESE